MQRIFFILPLIILLSCKPSCQNEPLKCVTSKLANEDIYYSSYFIKNNIKKEPNFFDEKTLIKNRNKDFLFLYKIVKNDYTSKILFLRVRNGDIYEFELKKRNQCWEIITQNNFKTKVEENEGTKLLFKIIDCK